MVTQSGTPHGRLAAGGKALWREINALHTLDPAQKVQLLEACRAKDRLDKLDVLLRGGAHTWSRLTSDVDGKVFKLQVDQVLDKANTTANLLKQLLAALRLPDVAGGKQPQQRGGARGAYKSTGKVSSLDRAREAKSRA